MTIMPTFSSYSLDGVCKYFDESAGAIFSRAFHWYFRAECTMTAQGAYDKYSKEGILPDFVSAYCAEVLRIKEKEEKNKLKVFVQSKK